MGPRILNRHLTAKLTSNLNSLCMGPNQTLKQIKSISTSFLTKQLGPIPEISLMHVRASVCPCIRASVCPSKFVRTITYKIRHGFLKHFGTVVALEEEKYHSEHFLGRLKIKITGVK